MNSMTSKLHSSVALWVSAPASCVDVDVCLRPVSSPSCVVWSSMMDVGLAWRQLCDGNLGCSRRAKAAEIDLWEPRAWCPAGTQPERGLSAWGRRLVSKKRWRAPRGRVPLGDGPFHQHQTQVLASHAVRLGRQMANAFRDTAYSGV